MSAGNRLDGRVALVTGGGRGLGRGVARVLAGLGASVVVSDRFVDEDGTAAAAVVAAEIEAGGGRAAPDTGDIASFDGAEAVVRSAVEAFGRLDILVTCAGTYAPSTILDVEQPEWEGLTAVHLVGHTACLAAAASVMRTQGDGGRIVTVSSRGGLFGPQTAYSGAKAAIMGLTTAAARELAPDGITVNCLLPSALTQLFPMDASRRRFGGMPLSLFMEPDDIAPVVAYLCLDEAAGVTGRSSTRREPTSPSTSRRSGCRGTPPSCAAPGRGAWTKWPATCPRCSAPAADVAPVEEYGGVFVDGGWRRSGGPRLEVVDPATEEVWAAVGTASSDDVDLAVAAAGAALARGEWASAPLVERIEVVRRLAELVQAHAPELARVRTRSMGAPYKASLGLSNSAGVIGMYIDTVQQVAFETVRRDAYGDSLVVREPVGTVAGIVPWNVPVRNELKKIVPSILAGCSVVLKPAPESPVAGALLMDLCREAGVPAGVVGMVAGGAEVGEALVRHPGVRKIAFTGSTATGARIAALAAPRFARLQLELGGKSAAVVLPDADLDLVARSLYAFGLGNSGQICAALTRVVVPRSRQAEVVDALVEAAGRHVVGDPMDEATTMGPLVSRAAREKALGLIAAATAEGARTACGGGVPAQLDRGWFVEPTVLFDVEAGATIAQQEVFGPVLAVVPYDDEDDAVRIANDSRYGLHGAVFSADEGRALAVARRIDTGTCAINSFDVPLSAPFGGTRESGVGRENGVEGYDSYLEYRSYKLTPALADALGPAEA